MSSKHTFILSLLINWAAFTNNAAVAFLTINRDKQKFTALYSTPISKTKKYDILDDEGSQTFEHWFQQVTKANDSLTRVRHSIFSNGIRGLEYIDSSRRNDHQGKEIITLPKNRVLYSTSPVIQDSNFRWDINLALQLLLEFRKGENSEYYGYCQLLSQGHHFETGSCPYSTAPNALRNWTNEQRDMFQRECGSRAKELLRMDENQKRDWMEQYNCLPTTLKSTFTLEQFVWAMEVVYSRSFRGDFISNLSTQIISSIVVPLAATALGVNYIISNPTQTNDIITFGLGVLGFLPLILKSLDPKNNDSEAVVLLPLIDSANHMEKADTRILYDPLQGIFTLSVSGENAFVDDEDCNGRKCTQLFITYGSKKDTELLLNYGFLPGVPLDINQETDIQRKLLIEAFRKRNL